MDQKSVTVQNKRNTLRRGREFQFLFAYLAAPMSIHSIIEFSSTGFKLRNFRHSDSIHPNQD